VGALSAAQLAAARQAGDYAAMLDLANKLTEKYELPADKYAREAQKIADAFASGAIDERTWARAMQDAQKLLEDGKGAAQGFQAALAGSAEAMFRLQEYRDRMRGPLVSVTPRVIGRPEGVPDVGQANVALPPNVAPNQQPPNVPQVLPPPEQFEGRWAAAARQAALDAVEILTQGVGGRFSEAMRQAALDAVNIVNGGGRGRFGGIAEQAAREGVEIANRRVPIHFTPDLGEVLGRIGRMADDLAHSIDVHFVPDLDEVNVEIADLAASLGNSIDIHFVPDMADVAASVGKLESAADGVTIKACIDAKALQADLDKAALGVKLSLPALAGLYGAPAPVPSLPGSAEPLPELAVQGGGTGGGREREPQLDVISQLLQAIKRAAEATADKELKVEFEGVNLT